MKNIDIVRVSKKHSSRQSQPFNKSKLAKKRKTKIGFALGYGLFEGLRSVFDGSIFAFSFLRNIFSIKPLIFILIPLVYFEIKYLFVLMPDEILSSLKSFLTPQNTFQFVAIGLGVLLLIIISWLLDTILVSGLLRYKYQKIDHRHAKASKSIDDIFKFSGGASLSKLINLTFFIFSFFLFVSLFYFGYILGYGSFSMQITLFLIILFIGVIYYAIYLKFRFTMQNSSAISLGIGKNKLLISIKQSFLSPLRSFCQGLVWLFVLLISISLSSFFAYLLINKLLENELINLSIIALALYSFLIYLIWTIWTAFSIGYWSSITNYEKHISKINFHVDREGDYFGFWIIIIILLIILVIYFVVSFMFSAQLSEFLAKAWEILPDSVKINVPKPN